VYLLSSTESIRITNEKLFVTIARQDRDDANMTSADSVKHI